MEKQNKYVVINFILKPTDIPLDKFAERLKFILEPAKVTMLLLGPNTKETCLLSRLELMLPEDVQEHATGEEITFMNFRKDSYGVISRAMKYLSEVADISHASTSITFTNTSVSFRIMYEIVNNTRNMFTYMMYTGKMLEANLIHIYDDVLDKDKWISWCTAAELDTYAVTYDEAINKKI